MSLLKFLGLSTFAVLSFAALNDLASAAMLTQNASFGPSITEWNTVFTFNKFDPSLGTLTDVTVSGIANLNASGTVTNTAAVTESFKVTENTTVTLGAFPDTNGTTISPSPSVSQLFNGLTAGSTANFGPLKGTDSASFDFTQPADLAAFIGAATTFNVAAGTLTGETIAGGGGNITSQISTTADVALTVTYTYTPPVAAPEPATLTLLGVGAVGGLLLRRRLKS